MFSSSFQLTGLQRAVVTVGSAAAALLLSGCAVVTVASTAVSVTAGVVGLAADATIGTAKIVGKGVGKAADALLDDEEEVLSSATEL